jgi:hypothetical protein
VAIAGVRGEGWDERMGVSDLPDRPDDLKPPGDKRGGADQNGSADRVRADSRTALQQRLTRLADGHPSSPNNEDGSPKPPIADLREFESAPEDDEHAEPGHAEAEHAEPGDADAERAEAEHAESEPERGDDSGSEGWQAALPRLQQLWERHIEYWPAKQRSEVERSDDEPGSWRGDAGRYLNYEENLVTEHALDRVSKAEPEVSRTMKAVEADVPGARLVGLQYCLKGEDRFKEKVAEELRAKPDRSIGQIGDNLPDAVRYTYQIEANRYVDGYRDVCQELGQNGYEMEFSRNSWDSAQYRGINTRWRTPAGQLVEVQFHTLESFSAKQLTHQAYERIRSPAASDLERDELYAFQGEVAAQVAVPEGAPAIPDYRKKEA